MGAFWKKLAKLKDDGGALREGDSSRIKRGGKGASSKYLTPEGETEGGGKVTRKQPEEVGDLKKVPGTDTYYTETTTPAGGTIKKYYRWDPKAQTLKGGRQGKGAEVPVSEEQKKKMPVVERYEGRVRSQDEALMVGEGEAYVVDTSQRQQTVQQRKPDMPTQEQRREMQERARYEQAEAAVEEVFTRRSDWEKLAFLGATSISWTDPLGLSSAAVLIGTGGDIGAFKKVKAQAVLDLESARGKPGDIALKTLTSPYAYVTALPALSLGLGKLAAGKGGLLAKGIGSVLKGGFYGYAGGELGTSLQGSVAYKQSEAQQRSFADLGKKYAILGPSLNLMLYSDARSVGKFLTEKINVEVKAADIRYKALSMQSQGKGIKFESQKPITEQSITGRSQADAYIKYETRLSNFLRRGPQYGTIKGSTQPFRSYSYSLEDKKMMFTNIQEKGATLQTYLTGKGAQTVPEIYVKSIYVGGEFRTATYSLPSDISYSSRFGAPWRTLDSALKSGASISIKPRTGYVLSRTLESGTVGALRTETIRSSGTIRAMVKGQSIPARVLGKTLVISEPSSKAGVTFISKSATSAGTQALQAQRQIQASPQITEEATKAAVQGLQRMSMAIRSVMPASIPIQAVAGRQKEIMKTREKTAQAIVPKTADISIDRQFRKVREATLMSPVTATTTSALTRQGIRTSSIEKDISAQVPASATIPRSIQTPKSIQREATPPTVIPRGMSPRIPSVIREAFPLTIPTIPMIGLGTSGERKAKKKKKRRGTRRRYGYTPTLGGITLGLTTPRTPKRKKWTGLEIRPVVGKIGKLLR